ncbi:MAG: transcription termination/antitermination NusG family protein [Pseudomonadota bacterium]
MSNWFIIKVTSGQEGKAERFLERMGYPYGWHPTHKVRMSEAIYQRLLRANKQLPAWAQRKAPPRYKVKPVVTGYVFVPAEEISVHQVNGHHTSQLWMQVLCVNGSPYRVKDEVMAQMKLVPERVQDLLDEARRAEQAAWEAKRPRVGEMARVIDGPFIDHVGPVARMKDGMVLFEVRGLLSCVHIPEQMVERVA